MFNSLFRRAEATFDHAISSALARLIVAIPFLVAAGFATAAASSYLTRTLGDENGYLILAAIFAVVGLLAWVAAKTNSTSVTERVEELAKVEEATAQAAGPTEASGAPIADSELIRSAMTAVGPIALPLIARLVVKNLPLIAALAAAGFVLTRGNDATETQSMQPAE